MSDLYEDTPEGEPKAPKPRRRLIDGELRGAYLPIRDHRRQQAAANREQCHCCTLDSPVINYTLRYPDDRSWANDHYPVSIEQARELGREREYSLDVTNMASSHLVCNRRRGSWAAASAGGVGPENERDDWIGEPSEAW